MRIYNVSPIYTNPIFKTKTKAKPKFSQESIADLAVFRHHIYEFHTGIRNLFLTTEKSKYKELITNRLERDKIAYTIHDISDDKINVYFGAQQCVDVVKSFNNKNLKKLTPEQDFILGIMLGYDRVKECERYLNILNGKIKLG